MNFLKELLRKRLALGLGVTAVAVLGIMFIGGRDSSPDWTTDTVTTGVVRNIVSVSGVIDAIDSAELAFPVGGVLQSIHVKEGDVVTKGTVLAVLSHDELSAEAQDAYATLLIAEADRNELLAGLRPEERDITETTADIAKQDLERIMKEQNELVENAYRTLLSSDLEARPKSSANTDVPPTIGGYYTCEDEGTYAFSMFRSGARSGYSYRLTGLESGIYTAYTEASAPFGTCGLTIQFAADESYGVSEWTVSIPNTLGDSYLANLNAYKLATIERENAIREAEQKLTLALQNETLDTALPRSEAVSRAEARVLQARAKLAAARAQIDDNRLLAPFDGVVSHVEPVTGETIGAEPIITMVSDGAYALTALVPEIDVTRIVVGQEADVVFDARPAETLRASVMFISPLAKEIDGVSYFEATLVLNDDVEWLRSGLNADVDIIVEERADILRIPKRYLLEKDGSYEVLVPDSDETRAVPVTVTFMGNDGFVGIDGLDAGSTIVAP